MKTWTEPGGCMSCSHTMQCVVPGVFWCPRCGTLETKGNPGEAPSLVARCRSFELCLNGSFRSAWHTHGIAEAINVPVNRLTFPPLDMGPPMPVPEDADA